MFNMHPRNGLAGCTAFIFLAVPLFADITATSPTAASEDQRFINEAGRINNIEVRIGELAVQKSSNNSVKTLAQRMIADHTRLNQELSRVAQQMNLTAPTDLDKPGLDLAGRLGRLLSAEFDKEYLRATIASHEAAIAAFTTESKEPGVVGETPVLEWARKTVPLLKADLVPAQAAAEALKPTQPGGGK